MDTHSRIAVVGATGTVGRELLTALQDAGVPAENLTALASERSAGEEIEYLDETLEVEKASEETFRGIKAALLAVPPDVARTVAPKAQAAGAWVVDVSAAFRGDTTVPLVLPTVNADVLRAPFKGRIVTTPSPVTTALWAVLAPLHRAFGVRRVHVTALMAASSAGRRGIAELEKQVADLLNGREAVADLLPQRIAFNVVPQVGEFEGGWSGEERAWREEADRLWSGKKAPPVISGTAVQVPLFYGHALSLSVELSEPVDEPRVRAELQKDEATLKVIDSPEEKIYPMPMLITADPTVHVGRLRAVPRSPGWFELFAVIDNAGRGAALNATEVLTALLGRPA